MVEKKSTNQTCIISLQGLSQNGRYPFYLSNTIFIIVEPGKNINQSKNYQRKHLSQGTIVRVNMMIKNHGEQHTPFFGGKIVIPLQVLRSTPAMTGVIVCQHLISMKLQWKNWVISGLDSLVQISVHRNTSGRKTNE